MQRIPDVVVWHSSIVDGSEVLRAVERYETPDGELSVTLVVGGHATPVRYRWCLRVEASHMTLRAEGNETMEVRACGACFDLSRRILRALGLEEDNE